MEKYKAGQKVFVDFGHPIFFDGLNPYSKQIVTIVSIVDDIYEITTPDPELTQFCKEKNLKTLTKITELLYV